MFRLPRSLTDAGYGSAVAAPGKRPVAFMILKMGRLREIISSSSPGQSPPITVTRRAMGSQLDGPPARSARGVARGNFKSGVWWRISTLEAASAKRPSVKRPANVRQLTVCWPKTAEFMPVTFLQLGTRGKHHVQTHKAACQDAPIAQAANAATAGRRLGRWRHLFIAGTTLNRR